jgi:hypothetical protein
VNERPLDPPQGIRFFKSTLSNDQQGCVEAAQDYDNHGWWLRNSNDPTKPAHFFTDHEWSCFTGGVKLGEFG